MSHKGKISVHFRALVSSHLAADNSNTQTGGNNCYTLIICIRNDTEDTEDMEEDEEMDEKYEEEEDTEDTGEEKEDNGSDNPDILDEQQTNHLKKIFNTIKDIKLNLNNRNLEETHKIMKTLFQETLDLALAKIMPRKNPLWITVREVLILYELKIHPRDRRNFRKLANEMCDKALNDSS